MRSQEEKWRVPEEDPAGRQPLGDAERLRLEGMNSTAGGPNDTARAQLIYCGLCGALNPATNFYCAACGTTLVDAFHGSEGLRVYDRPDTASRLIEIVPPGAELDVVDDPDAPPDFTRVTLSHGRLGYIRLADVAALAQAGTAATHPPPPLSTPDVNVNARGCVTQSGALGALVLMVVLSALVFVWISQTDSPDSDIMALAACLTLGPLLVITVVLYVVARSRDERLEWLAAEAAERERSDVT